MFTKLIVISIAGTLALTIWLPVSAQEPQAEISGNVPVAVLIDGRESESLPVMVSLGAQVCIASNLRYLDVGERQRFDSWSFVADPGAASRNLEQLEASLEDECIRATEPGRYTAKYIHEALFQVRSEVKKYQQSSWVTRGEVVEVEVPSMVTEGENKRHRFLGWTSGESPFTPGNRIAVLGPTVLEARWAVEYSIKVEDYQGNPVAPSGWHAENTELVLRAERVIPSEDGRGRLTFRKWNVVFGPFLKRRTDSVTALQVKGPGLIRPEYTESYLVEAMNFQGPLLEEWVEAGGHAALKSPATIETDPERERFAFKEWLGAADLQGSEVDLVVNGPMALEAVYERQFKLIVSSPYGGSGEGWYKEGGDAIIMAPEEPQSMLFFKRTFDGFLGYGDGKMLSDAAVATVVVDKPMTITAAYRSEINPKVLFLLVGVVGAGTLAYVGTEWGPGVYRRFRQRR